MLIGVEQFGIASFAGGTISGYELPWYEICKSKSNWTKPSKPNLNWVDLPDQDPSWVKMKNKTLPVMRCDDAT